MHVICNIYNMVSKHINYWLTSIMQKNYTIMTQLWHNNESKSRSIINNSFDPCFQNKWVLNVNTCNAIFSINNTTSCANNIFSQNISNKIRTPVLRYVIKFFFCIYWIRWYTKVSIFKVNTRNIMSVTHVKNGKTLGGQGD